MVINACDDDKVFVFHCNENDNNNDNNSSTYIFYEFLYILR